jgi:ubiquinone/menaquinone biosynthesis C-methylase UbiE
VPHDSIFSARIPVEMQPSPTKAKLSVASTYNAAAEFFDAPALPFRDRIGRRTVDRMALKNGASVLDACCGSGASAIPAAEAVGANGRLLGVDLAESLLRLARAKASRLGLAHTEFRLGDFEKLDPATESFDAVICVFGIFFLPNMVAGIRSLWRLLGSRGQLAITTWGPRALEPGNSAFWEAVRKERPDLYRPFNPWERINNSASLYALLLEGGVKSDQVVADATAQPLNSPEDFWTIAMGASFRGTIQELDLEARERVREATTEYISRHNVRSVETNAVSAIATKP